MREGELLDAIGCGVWARAGEATLELLHSGRFRDPSERTNTSILLAQARILGQLDPRRALTALLPAVTEIAEGNVDAAWSARAHVVSAFILSAPGYGILFQASSTDPDARTRHLDASLHLARDLLTSDEHRDLRALSAIALLGVGVDLPSTEHVQRLYPAVELELDGADAPVTRVLAMEARAVAAFSRAKRMVELERALELARALEFAAAEARLRLLMVRELCEGGGEGPKGRAAGAPDGMDESARRRTLRMEARAALQRGDIDAPWLEARIDAPTIPPP